MSIQRFKKDYYGGALMVLVGLSAAYASSAYRVGELARMGPGFFPRAVGVLLAATGVLIALAARSDDGQKGHTPGHAHGMPDLRGALCIVGGVLAFIFLGDYTGLLPATFAITFLSALGDRDNRLHEVLLLSVLMMVVAAGVFWWGLSLQLPLVTWRF